MEVQRAGLAPRSGCWGALLSGGIGCCAPVSPRSGAFREHFCTRCINEAVWIPATRIRVVEDDAPLANAPTGGVWNEPVHEQRPRKRSRALLPPHRVVNQTVCSLGPKLVILQHETKEPLAGLACLADEVLRLGVIGFAVGKTLKPLTPLSLATGVPPVSGAYDRCSAVVSQSGSPQGWPLKVVVDTAAAELIAEADELRDEAVQLVDCLGAAMGAGLHPPPVKDVKEDELTAESIVEAWEDEAALTVPELLTEEDLTQESLLQLLLPSPPTSPPESVAIQRPALRKASVGVILAVAVPFLVAIFGPNGVFSSILEIMLAHRDGAHRTIDIALAVPWPCIAYLVQVVRFGVGITGRSWVAFVLSALSFRILGACLLPLDVLAASREASNRILEGQGFQSQILPIVLAAVNECQSLERRVRAPPPHPLATSKPWRTSAVLYFRRFCCARSSSAGVCCTTHTTHSYYYPLPPRYDSRALLHTISETRLRPADENPPDFFNLHVYLLIFGLPLIAGSALSVFVRSVATA